MILLKFKEGQGLGNQLWNYVVLRKIAELKNLKYKIINTEEFKGKEFLDIKFNNTNKKVDIELFETYKEDLV